MACVLYSKKGEAIRCDLSEVEYHLQNGYLKDHPDRKLPDRQNDGDSDILEQEVEALEDKIDDKEDEIRALAKDKGLKRVGVKSVDTLLEEIEQLEAKESAAED